MLESILPLQPATAVAVDKYCHTHSTPLPPLFADHQAWTVEKFDKWLMLSGPVQAQLFSFLVSDRGATRVLELGTFTGYSALAWKEGMKDVKGEVWTCEANSMYIEASKEAFRKHDTEGRIHLLEGPAIETLRRIKEEPFDLIYVDARKSEYIEYVKIVLERNLLAPKGIMLVDDTVHKGLVAGADPLHLDPDSTDRIVQYDIYHVKAVNEFNSWAVNQPNLDVVVLPIFNGLSLVKLKSTSTL